MPVLEQGIPNIQTGSAFIRIDWSALLIFFSEVRQMRTWIHIKALSAINAALPKIVLWRCFVATPQTRANTFVMWKLSSRERLSTEGGEVGIHKSTSTQPGSLVRKIMGISYLRSWEYNGMRSNMKWGFLKLCRPLDDIFQAPEINAETGFILHGYIFMRFHVFSYIFWIGLTRCCFGRWVSRKSHTVRPFRRSFEDSAPCSWCHWANLQNVFCEGGVGTVMTWLQGWVDENLTVMLSGRAWILLLESRG